MRDLISIIVPVYKVEPYLDACVESIVKQTHRELEIILVDDGSPDRCPAMCDAWAERDSRIRVIHKINGGAAAARNAGLDIARGEYIGFVDSDDMIRPDMYEVLLDALHKTGKKIACCQSGWTPGEAYEKQSPNILAMDTEDTVKAILTRRVGTALWRRLYHRSLWDGLRLPEGQINEDYPVLIPTAVAAGGMVEVREKLYFYRPTPDSVTATGWKKDTGIVLENLELMHRQIQENGLNCTAEFRDFVIHTCYFGVVAMEKHLPELSPAGRDVHRRYLRAMRKLWVRGLYGRVLRWKDKAIYLLIVTRTLRPVYKLFGRL